MTQAPKIVQRHAELEGRRGQHPGETHAKLEHLRSMIADTLSDDDGCRLDEAWAESITEDSGMRDEPHELFTGFEASLRERGAVAVADALADAVAAIDDGRGDDALAALYRASDQAAIRVSQLVAAAFAHAYGPMDA